MINGRHVYEKASDMANTKICKYPQSDHALSQWNLYCDGVLTVHVSKFLTKKEKIEK